MVVVADGDFLPLVDCERDGSECIKKTKRRMFKMASRCQVRQIHNLSASNFALTVFSFLRWSKSVTVLRQSTALLQLCVSQA